MRVRELENFLIDQGVNIKRSTFKTLNKLHYKEYQRFLQLLKASSEAYLGPMAPNYKTRIGQIRDGVLSDYKAISDENEQLDLFDFDERG